MASGSWNIRTGRSTPRTRALSSSGWRVPRAARGGWRIAQPLAVAALLALTGALVFAPAYGLRILWGAVIPALPVLWLIQPGLWRNVCPMATLNMYFGQRGQRRRLTRNASTRAPLVGTALLFVLVPARTLVFDRSATAVIAALAAFAVLAAVGGSLFDRKAGFCNTLCPMLAVERLYGEAPLVHVTNARCRTCTACTTRACIDLGPRKSLMKLVKNWRGRRATLLGLHGSLAVAFPGFVIAYFLLPADPSVGMVYGGVAIGAVSSWVLAMFATLIGRVDARHVLQAAALAAFGAFYWFSGRAIVDMWRLHDSAVWAVRVGAFLLLALWIAARRRGRPFSASA